MNCGMVVAAQPEAVEAGAEVLAAGGNAVDAAVAAALVQTAVDPQMGGIAGFGCMHVYRPGASGMRRSISTPACHGGRPDMWADKLVGEIR